MVQIIFKDQNVFLFLRKWEQNELTASLKIPYKSVWHYQSIELNIEIHWNVTHKQKKYFIYFLISVGLFVL